MLIVMLLLMLPYLTFAQKNIEELSTHKDLREFIWEEFPQEREIYLEYQKEKQNWEWDFVHCKKSHFETTCRALYKALNPSGFEKMDFDKNGYMDLLVFAYPEWEEQPNPYLILSYGKGNYEKVLLPSKGLEISNCMYPLVQLINTRTVLLKYNFCKVKGGKIQTNQIDTLVRELNFWREIGEKSNHKIDSISFEISSLHTGNFDSDCFATKITIDAQLNVTYEKEMIGNRIISSTCKISKDDFLTIEMYLNSINFNKLNDNYSYPISHAEYAMLNVSFDGNQEKKINDYGMWGTYGLVSFYSLLEQIKKGIECVK